MVSSTQFNEEDLKLAEPQESEFYTRPGFQRKNYRYDFANSTNIGINDRYVEEGDQIFVNPETTEMPYGPSGIGEVGGAGVDFIETEGDIHPTFRFNQGFTVAYEDVQAGKVDISEQRRYLMEMLDFFADGMWFNGITDRQGNQLRPGMFQWLKSAIPDERTFDGENLDGDSGDDHDLVSNDTQENLINYLAYEQQSGELMNDGQSWDVVLGRRSALSHLNKVRPADGGIVPRDSYWDAINVPDQGKGVGIQRQVQVPDRITFSDVPNGYDPITIDLTQHLGPNELLVLPDMEQVRQKYWRLRQMPSALLFDPIQKEGGRRQFDYVWRYSHSFDPKNTYNTAQDSIHITNVDKVFV